MAFQGLIEELPLPDLLQLVAVGSKTGAFELKRSGESAHIYILRGQIVHATLGEVSGEEAVYAVALWDHGEFRFEQGVESGTVTIQRSNTNLLMEAARRTDEWKVLLKKVPSTRLIPVLLPLSTTTSVSLMPAEWEIVRWSDGRRNIEEIAAAVGRARFEVCSTIYGLVTSGVIALEEPPTPPAPAAGATAASPRAAAAGRAPMVNFREVAQRASQIVYRGLGPEGEAQVLKIERASSAADLATVLERSRDLLRRIGREGEAIEVDAEITRLRGS